jgi:hypothetical protein
VLRNEAPEAFGGGETKRTQPLRPDLARVGEATRGERGAIIQTI